MKAATTPIQRPGDARLLAIDADGALLDLPRTRLAERFEPGDLLIANDAATLPASLAGVHGPSGTVIEVRLAGRPSLEAADVHRLVAGRDVRGARIRIRIHGHRADAEAPRGPRDAARDLATVGDEDLREHLLPGNPGGRALFQERRDPFAPFG
jgi:S-adenosylmethionine:tRNA-ribosyltransferase-isomerase (queuine synthetase)